MKNFFYFLIILFLIILAVGVVEAVGFSPSSLEYNLKIGEKNCKMINLNSESELITVNDKWAENKDVEWKTNLFDKDASYHGLSVNYDNELSLDERNVEVCFKGDKTGEYHGVLLMTENQVGSSVIQMGVWLKAIISDSSETGSSNSGQSSSSGSGSGGGFISKNNKTNSVNKSMKIIINKTQNFDNYTNLEGEAKEDTQKEFNDITGAAIGAAKNNLKIILIALMALAIIGIYIYNHQKKEKFL